MSLDAIRDETNVMQARAASPTASAWVSANAGTGKTHVLVQRVLRLLLTGTQPERILCLTFTKAAASEMSNRLFRDLSQWTVLDDEALFPIVSRLLGRGVSDQELSRARQLFALALETPGGLKVQTIHAFCERLLQRFPLEASIAPHFGVLDEEQERTLIRQCVDQVLTKASQEKHTPLGHALSVVIAYAGDSYFDDVLGEALSERARLTAAIEGREPGGADSAIERKIREKLGLVDGVSEDSLIEQMAGLLSNEDIGLALPILDAGKTTDQKLAMSLRSVRASTNNMARMRSLAEAFLTKTGSARADRSFITSAVREDRPDIAEKLFDARDKFAELYNMLGACRAASASAALMQLAGDVTARYAQVKASRAVLDFEDLIVKTAQLLATSTASQWVLYKLDGGIDHILVDEAQDTSPAAWNVIETLADEFFAGQGVRETVRTVFAVGDEKQSIYGFQGAVPERFAEMGASFSRRAALADVVWHRVPLTLSFRSTSPVLEAVDHVFGGQTQLSGISAGGDDIRHFANRVGQAGRVEVWDTEKPDAVLKADPWDPLAQEVEDDPKSRLANRIADQIDGWLRSEEMLASHGRPVRAGDILILVRKRAPFAPAMIAALKARDIPVAGADRIRLAEQLAVKDLMALGDFLLLPEDDLALATVLKSPLFDLDDDDLFKIGYERRNSLWEALQGKVEGDEIYADVCATLKFFLSRSDLKPPYEFFESLLDWQSRRERFVERLGPEAGDAIDEFLNLALTYDDMAPPSLQGFMGWMRSSSAEVKRDMEQGRNEVRVMTVHGAKGLEANIVFMPDTCSSKGAQRSQSVLPLEDEGGGAQSLLWAVPAAKNLERVTGAREDLRAKAQEEYHRLLYVAMTRARDRLYVCGFESKTGRDRDCWYDLVRSRLEPHLTASVDEKGRDIWHLGTPQSTDPDRHDDLQRDVLGAFDLPSWADEKAPAEPMKTVPVAPSVFAPFDENIVDEEREEAPSEAQDQPIMPPRQMAENVRFLRGTLTHALLQHLPGMDAALWQSAAARLVEAKGGALSSRVREEIVRETLSILTDSRFAPLFGEESMAEVPLTARIESDVAGVPPVQITGQIDRLAVVGDRVLVVDYKTNRPPPREAENVAGAYLTQLAAYRLAIQKIYPNKQVSCSILWTDGPRMMDIPEDLLISYGQELRGGKSVRG